MPPRQGTVRSTQTSRTPSQPGQDQIVRFKELARALGCDKNEAAFEDALNKIANSKPLQKHEPKSGKQTTAS